MKRSMSAIVTVFMSACLTSGAAADEKYWGTDSYNGYGPWLGGYQDGQATEPAKGWSWITGEPWEYDNWSAGAGEPNDGDGLEDHAEDYLHFFCYGSHGSEAK